MVFILLSIKKPSNKNDDILHKIKELYVKSGKTYGSPRIYQECKTLGIAIGRHKIATIMRDNQIIARKKRRKIKPRLMTAETMAAPNILARDFLPSAPSHNAPAKLHGICTHTLSDLNFRKMILSCYCFLFLDRQDRKKVYDNI